MTGAVRSSALVAAIALGFAAVTVGTTESAVGHLPKTGNVSTQEVPAVPEVSAAAQAEVPPTSEAAGPPAPAAQPQVS
jgi:hypothetical protein